MLLLSNEQVERDFSNFNLSLTSGGFSLPHKLTSPLSVPVTPCAIFCHQMTKQIVYLPLHPSQQYLMCT